MKAKMTKINGSHYNLPSILRMVDAEARAARGGSERTMIEMVARLIRDQQAEIARITSAPRIGITLRTDAGIDITNIDELQLTVGQAGIYRLVFDGEAP